MAAADAARTQFFARSALLMVFLALTSFPFTYLAPFVSGSRQFVMLHHVHGLAFFAWIGLYIWQTQLAARGKVARHREIGLAALLVSGTMVPLGWWMALYAARVRIEKGWKLPFEFTLYNIVDISLFSLSIMAAVLSVGRRIEWHRRFMFAAALNLVGPAISRWFIPLPIISPWTDFAPSILADLFLIALALHDRRTLGRIHPATLLCAAIMVPLHLLTPLVATSHWWNTLAPAMLAFD